MTKQIRLGRYGTDGIAYVDDEDYKSLIQYTWSLLLIRNNAYARRTVKLDNGVQKTILMHRVIMGDTNLEVDHIDNNGLNNIRSNLRLATDQQQAAHRFRSRVRTKVQYKGIIRNDSKIERYSAQIMVNGIRINSGPFSTQIEAALEYNRLAEKHFGLFAVPNKFD